VKVVPGEAIRRLDKRRSVVMSSVEQEELKRVVKEAVQEVMMENSEMLRDLLAEVLEDVVLLRRMEEGRETELISRAEVMDLLEPKP
jgi:hypothetical protein